MGIEFGTWVENGLYRLSFNSFSFFLRSWFCVDRLLCLVTRGPRYILPPTSSLKSGFFTYCDGKDWDTQRKNKHQIMEKKGKAGGGKGEKRRNRRKKAIFHYLRQGTYLDKSNCFWSAIWFIILSQKIKPVIRCSTQKWLRPFRSF